MALPEKGVMMDSMEKKFGQMTGGEKIAFLGKLIVFICTFGFAFPTILHDPEYIKRFH
jgi:hypothetical protein